MNGEEKSEKSYADDLPAGIIKTDKDIYVLVDDTHLSRWVAEHGRLDIAVPQIAGYAHLIPGGGTVVDAGAAIGDHTLTYAQKVHMTGHVFAFEPHPLAFECLKRNMASFPNVHCEKKALSNQLGDGGLSLEANAGASFIDGLAEAHKNAKIEFTLLDSYASKFGRLDFIHLDCEGYEFYALSGAREVIIKFRPAIVLEVNHHCLARYGLGESDLRRMIESLNYDWSETHPDHGTHLPQRDVLATPRPVK